MATILKNNAGDLDTPKFYFYAVEFIEIKAALLGEDFCRVKYPRPDAGPYILLTLDGNEAEVKIILTVCKSRLTRRAPCIS